MSSCCQCQISPGGAGNAPDAVTRAQARLWLRLVIATVVAAQSMIFSLAVNLSPPEGRTHLIVHGLLALSAVAVFFLVGGDLLRGALRAARSGRVVIEQLFLAGIAGAFFASLHCSLTGVGHVYYEVVAILLAIFTFGKVLGEQRREAAREAARRIGSEFSVCEVILPGGKTTEISVAGLREGDRVRVAAGAAIPADGIIEHGTAFVRESALTGESYPVVRRPGDTVRAGSYTLDQALEIRATANGGQRVLDRLLESVRTAQDTKTRLQTEADRIVAWFLPAVLVITVLTFAVWTTASGWQTGLFNALAVLVVACPCSMGLATPVGIWAALSSLARRGIMSRTGDIVEELARTTTVVFDKTGTLGTDRMQLVDFVCAPEFDRAEVLRAVGAVEATSRHPIAMGFRTESVAPAEEVKPLPGIGIAGVVGGSVWSIGNEMLTDSANQDVVENLRASSPVSREGTHEVWVLRDGRIAGVGILREELKSGALATLSELRSEGLRCIVMTGDRESAARAHGLGEFLAELSPGDKEREVEKLRAAGARVLFVGDGINDAPAMARSDASIALATGSALANETASASLAGGDPGSVVFAIRRCRAVVRAIRRNLMFAAAYNFAGISLAAAGVLHPVAAALLMLLSSMTVTWQVLRNTEEPGEAREEPETGRHVEAPLLPVAHGAMRA